MSRALLFVQNGTAKPKVLATGARNEAAARLAAEPHGRYFDRWWLVECENAEAGRRIIAGIQSAPGGDEGRILASGGRQKAQERERHET